MQDPQLLKEFSKLTNKIIRGSGESCSHYQSEDTSPSIQPTESNGFNMQILIICSSLGAH